MWVSMPLPLHIAEMQLAILLFKDNCSWTMCYAWRNITHDIRNVFSPNLRDQQLRKGRKKAVLSQTGDATALSSHTCIKPLLQWNVMASTVCDKDAFSSPLWALFVHNLKNPIDWWRFVIRYVKRVMLSTQWWQWQWMKFLKAVMVTEKCIRFFSGTDSCVSLRLYKIIFPH